MGSTVLGFRVQVQNVTGAIHRGHTADAVESSGPRPSADAAGGDTEVSLSASGVHQSCSSHKRASLLRVQRAAVRRPETPSPVS